MIVVGLAGFLLGVVTGLLVMAVLTTSADVDKQSTRALYIERLLMTGSPEAREYAEVLELMRPIPDETLEDLNRGYLEYLHSLPQLPPTDRIPIRE